jgi:hypothetical protein
MPLSTSRAHCRLVAVGRERGLMAQRTPAASWCSNTKPVPVPVRGCHGRTVSARPPVRCTIGTVP